MNRSLANRTRLPPGLALFSRERAVAAVLGKGWLALGSRLGNYHKTLRVQDENVNWAEGVGMGVVDSKDTTT